MAFASNTERHSFPHRITTGWELNGVTVGPGEIVLGHLPGSVLSNRFEDGVLQTRRKRKKIRTFNLKYDLLHSDEWPTLWQFYEDYAEQIQYYFYINLYYFDTIYSNEWIGVNFAQETQMKNFVPILGEIGFDLIENVQATLTRTAP